MRAGFKLDVNYWDDARYLELFKERDILLTLWDKGFRALEIPVGPRTDRILLSEHIRRCSAAGFALSIHPYSESSECNLSFFTDSQQNPCRRFHEEMFFMAMGAALEQKGVAVVNIHPAADFKTIPRKELLERSVRFFSWAVQWCASYTQEVLVTAELQIAANPEEAIVRIGDNFQDLEEVAFRSGCGICWDFGHAFLNNLRYGVSQEPGPELLGRVIHVHCHDVLKDDHWPLLSMRSGWDEKLKLLYKNGFNGTVIMEVPPRNFLLAGGFEAFERSVEALFNVVSGFGGEFVC